MWAIGILLLLVLTAAAVALLNRRRTAPLLVSHWDLTSLGASYAGVVAPLAAFSVASAVFLANLTRAAQTRAFEHVMALFLMGFISIMGTALMFATLRSGLAVGEPTKDFVVSRRVLYVLSNLGFYLGLNLSWLGLQPLLRAIELEDLARVFSWLLLFSILSGSARLGAWCYSLLGANALASYAVTVVALLAACAYRLLLVPRVGALWPANATITLCIVVFAFGAMIFFVETNMIRFHSHERAHALLARLGSVVSPPYIAATVTSLLLLWFSLVLT